MTVLRESCGRRVGCEEEGTGMWRGRQRSNAEIHEQIRLLHRCFGLSLEPLRKGIFIHRDRRLVHRCFAVLQRTPSLTNGLQGAADKSEPRLQSGHADKQMR
jgi:hypothetical protein